MSSQALGLLETKGLTALVQGTDAMLKSANIQLAGPMKAVGSGYACAYVTGDVAAVKAAIDAGAQNAQQYGQVVTSHVIARPHEDVAIAKNTAGSSTKTADSSSNTSRSRK
mgnify:CR=1 FL=1